MCCLEQQAPRSHIWTTAQQGAALPLGHATPNPELHAIIEGISEALGSHRAAQADVLGSLLSGSLDEEGVGVGAPASRFSGPVALERHTRSTQSISAIHCYLATRLPTAGDVNYPPLP